MTVTQHHLAQILGAARLQRLMSANWLVPVQRTPSKILFRTADVHAALRRLELERCPPDRIEIARIRDSERRHGRSYKKKERPPRPGIDAIIIDWDTVKL